MSLCTYRITQYYAGTLSLLKIFIINHYWFKGILALDHYNLLWCFSLTSMRSKVKDSFFFTNRVPNTRVIYFNTRKAT